MDFFLNFDKMKYFTKMKPDGCILCHICAGNPEVEDLTVARTADFVCCVNMYPYNPGHVMIFPSTHIEDIRGLSPAAFSALQVFQKSILDTLDALYHPTAYNIGCNMGLDAGASLKHLHIHIIPRYPHELGFADLLSGKKALVENPLETQKKMRQYLQTVVQ